MLLLISNSGKTREIVELTELAARLNPELKKIVITGNPDSPLAEAADICLATGHPDEVCLLGMTPTTSTTVMTVIGDIWWWRPCVRPVLRLKNTASAIMAVIWENAPGH